MLRRALSRVRRGRPWLGQWTPAFALTALATAVTLFYSFAPHWYDMERYWLAWLGDGVLGGRLPRAAGPESPYDIGHPWMPVEWLYAVAVAWMREHRAFAVFAALNGVAATAILWWALGACIARRVPGNVTTLIVAASFVPVVERYELRAEAIGSALLVGVLAWGTSPVKRFLLVPLFAVWANVHPSFAFGLFVVALQALDALRRRDRAGVAVLVACAAATLCNPFGIALWAHVWWISHGWIARIVPEWQPLLRGAPLDAFLLWIPLVSLLLRQGMRRRPVLDWVLWPVTVALAFSSQRFVALATGIGAPAACGAFRQRDIPVPRAAAWIVAAAAAWAGTRGLGFDARELAAGTAADRDFGLVLARSAPAAVERGVDLRGKLVSCVPGFYCNAALYLGARTLYDGRTEPFGAARILELSASLKDPKLLAKWPVDVAIVRRQDAPRLAAGASWREVASSPLVAVFERQSR